MTFSKRPGHGTRIAFRAALTALLIGATGPLAAQSIMRGSIVDDETNEPISTVELSLIDADGETRVSIVSDEEGIFRMEVADSGTYSLAVRRVGYASVTADEIEVAEDDELELEIKLSPSAVPLEAVTVVARRRAEPSWLVRYRERAEFNRRLGRGRIYMREDIDRIRPNSAQELLDRVFWGPRCRPQILLDGLPASGHLTSLSGDLIEGVEIYRGVTQIPPEYYRYGMCGLAMVWTRMDGPGMRPFTWRRLGVAALLVGLVAFLAR